MISTNSLGFMNDATELVASWLPVLLFVHTTCIYQVVFGKMKTPLLTFEREGWGEV